MFLLLLVLAVPVFLCLLWFVNFWNSYKHLKTIPSPRTYPIIGNSLEFKSSKDAIRVFQGLFEKYNSKLLRINLGPRTAIVIKDYDLLEFLLSSNRILTKSHGYTFLYPWLGTGLLTGSGDKWRKHRKMITPSFHFQILEQFVDVFNSVADVLIDRLKNEVGKGSTDIYPFINLYSLDVICETAMGTSVNAQMTKDSIYVKCVKDMCRIIQNRSFNVLYHFNFFFQFSSDYKEQTKALEVLHGYTNSVIKKRREQLSKKNSVGEVDDVGAKKRIAFLDLLLKSTVDGKPLSDSDIREEVDTFMFAGHDTISAATSFVLFQLSKHPDIQQKVYQEIEDVLGTDTSSQISYNDMQNLKYMELVIKETLRLYPSVPFYVRLTTEEIKYKDFTIPKNTALNIFAYGIHRDPKYFPDPEKFDPERFSTNQQLLAKYPYAYIPFSAGPRNCIGQKYAMLEMKVTIAKILKNFEIMPVVPEHILELVPETILMSTNGILIKVEARNKR